MSFREFDLTRDNRAVTSDPDALPTAAFRLKHDLGKAIRWNAPAARETDAEALRRRLRRDLAETRVGPDGRPRSAVEIYEAWLSQDGALFTPARLSRISEAIERIRRRLPRLSELDWDDLVALDETSLRLQEEVRALWLESVTPPSEEAGP